MALSKNVGSFVAPNSTASPVNISLGSGFDPKIALFWVTPKSTADGSNTSAGIAFGYALVTGEKGSVSVLSAHSAATSSTYIIQRNDYAIARATSGGIAFRANVSAWNSDSIDITITTADANQRIVNYLILGGSDIEQVAGFTIQCPAAAGNQDHSLAWQPDAFIAFCGSLNASNQTIQSAENGHIGFGWGLSSSVQGFVGNFNGHGQAVQVAKRRQRTDTLLEWFDGSATLARATYQGPLAGGGFRLNWSDVHANRPYAFGFAIKGPRFAQAVTTQKTSTGNDDVTGASFDPEAALEMSDCNVADSAIVANARFSFGGVAGAALNQGVIWAGDSDAFDTTRARCDLDRTRIVQMMTEDTPTTQAEASVSAWLTGGYRRNWTTADATARQILSLLIGPAAAAVAGSSTAAGAHESLLPESASPAGALEALEFSIGGSGGGRKLVFPQPSIRR